MKLSELIAGLEQELEANGDCNVMVDDRGEFKNITHVDTVWMRDGGEKVNVTFVNYDGKDK